MSQPRSSSDNEDLVRPDGQDASNQSEYGYTSGAEQMTSEERERQRNIQSNALENAGDPRLVEERIIPEGMGGAGGGDVEDVGDVGFPEEAGGGPTSAQQQEFVGQTPVAPEGMGGAGGGDLDDIGDVGNPRRPTVSLERGPDNDADARFAEAWRMAGGEGPDPSGVGGDTTPRP